MTSDQRDISSHDDLMDGEPGHDGLGSPSAFDEAIPSEDGVAAAIDDASVAPEVVRDVLASESMGIVELDDDLDADVDFDENGQYDDDYDEDDYDEDDDATQRKRRSGGSVFKRILVLVIVAVLFFCLGEFAASWGWPGLLQAPRTYVGDQMPASESVLRLNEVATWLDREAINSIDIDQATQGTIEGLLQSTGDQHAVYMDQGYLSEYLNYSSGSYSGIGVVIAQVGNYVLVGNVYADSPAAKAGVQVGDAVVSIDGDARQWTTVEVREAIAADAGSTCDIVWLRPTSESLEELITAAEGDSDAQQGSTTSAAASVVLEGQELKTQVECTDIVIPNITQQMMGTVGYVALYSFNAQAGQSVEDAVTSLQEQGATSLVLDLRGNGGGYVQQALRIASLFMPQGDVMQLKEKDGTTTHKVDGNAICDLPLVVLVNGESASASEIVTAALKYNGRATVVGTVTYGKGTVQNIRLLSYGGAVKYTVAEYLGPNGEVINQVGIQPDIEVSAPSGFVLGTSPDDPQLQRAVEVAQQLVQ